MKVANPVYDELKIRWSALTMPLEAGTPVSKNGTIANDENAIGIVPQDVEVKPEGVLDNIRILVGGDVILTEAEAEYGASYTDACKEALKGFNFYLADGTIWSPSEGESGSGVCWVNGTITGAQTDTPTVTLDKTVDEMLDAYDDGQEVVLKCMGTMCPAMVDEYDEVRFVAFTGAYFDDVLMTQFTIAIDDASGEAQLYLAMVDLETLVTERFPSEGSNDDET